MRWRVAWTPWARAALQRMPWTDAARIDEAVQLYARSGEGDVYRLTADSPTSARMRVGSYRVRLIFERRARVMHVWIVFRE